MRPDPAESQVDPASIDETYPVAGQDNDSQGFRDNFFFIKTGLETARAELQDLIENTARIDDTSNFNGNLIDNVQTNRMYGKSASRGIPLESEVDIDFNFGEYHYVTLQGDSTFRIENLPDADDSIVKMTIEISVDIPSPIGVNFTSTGISVFKKKYENVTPDGRLEISPTTAVRIVELWVRRKNDVVVMFIHDKGEFEE